jgi:hypothetical protein
MPGSVGIVSGAIQDRPLGRSVISAGCRQRMGKGAALMAGGGNIFVGISAAGIGNGADTTEDILFSVLIPAGTLDLVGRQFLIEAYGSVAATSATKNARIYFGSTSLTTAFVGTTTQAGIWSINALITKAGPNSQSAFIGLDYTIGSPAVPRVSTILSLTESDTAGIIIKVTGQSSVATANLVTCNLLSVSGYN